MGCSETKLESLEGNNFIKKNSNKYQFEVYASIKEHDLEKVKGFMETKFNVKYKMVNFSGRTALHIAAEYGDLKIAGYLLEKGADIDALDSSDCPPIFYAMQKGHLELVKFLIQAQADIYITTSYGLSLHHYMCGSKTTESLNLLKHYKYNKLLKSEFYIEE